MTKRVSEWYSNKGYEFKPCEVLLVKAEDLSPGNKNKVKVKCDYCGKIIDVVWKDYFYYTDKKYACKSCRQTKTSEKSLKDRQDYLYGKIKTFCDSKGYILLTKKTEILNSNTKVHYICPKHGMYEEKAYSLLLGHGCIHCLHEEASDRQRFTKEDIILFAQNNNIQILNPEDYVNCMEINLKCVCQKCGRVYTTSYNALKNGKTLVCGNCTKSISTSEFKIMHYLEDNNIEYVYQKKFEKCRYKGILSFDFYIPKYNLLIEANGRQHYEPVEYFGGINTYKEQITRDNIKRAFCIENNLDLLEIPYYDFDKIEEILNIKLFMSRYSLFSCESMREEIPC